MGELKELRSQQESLVERAKEINRKLWLAGLGAVSKAEEEGRKQLDKYRYAGELAIGSEAAEQNRYLVAARGLVATLRSEGDELVNKLVEAGKKQKGPEAGDSEYVLAVIGAFATLRDESQRIFDDLVATGEKRQGPDA
ncbi:MAG: phasin family protein [Pseudomonadota bacterium]